jgi:hypothetical protein
MIFENINPHYELKKNDTSTKTKQAKIMAELGENIKLPALFYFCQIFNTISKKFKQENSRHIQKFR